MGNQDPFQQILLNFLRYGKGIDKGFVGVLIFLIIIIYRILDLPIESDKKAQYAILIGILAVFLFDRYAKHKGKSTIEKESEEDLKEGRISKKTYEKIVEEK